MILNRSKREVDPHLDRKVGFFLAGAALAVVGMGLGSSLMVGLAIAVLMVGLLLRFLPGGAVGVEAGERDEREASDEDLDYGSSPSHHPPPHSGESDSLS